MNNRKQKIDVLKNIAAGKRSLKDLITPSVLVIMKISDDHYVGHHKETYTEKEYQEFLTKVNPKTKILLFIKKY